VELLELIAEKDAELKQLHKELGEKNELVQKLVKSSSEVLEKCQLLQADNIALTTSKNILEKTVTQHEVTINNNKVQIEAQAQQITSLTADVNRYTVEINERFDDISRLQTRCATLVSEKAEKTRNFEDLTISSTKKAKKLQVTHIQLFCRPFFVSSALHLLMCMWTCFAGRSVEAQELSREQRKRAGRKSDLQQGPDCAE
jgi:SMC interacting uncharacterized protein involved in chromosome segregation